MRIRDEVLRAVLASAPDAPPEIGGILGGTRGVVDSFLVDHGVDGGGCYYCPDVIQLNEIIRTWQENGTEFMGVFHCHFFGVCTLSGGDIDYMTDIMRSMPEQITSLAFPVIVMPERIMVSYAAARADGDMKIYRDDLIIL